MESSVVLIDDAEVSRSRRLDVLHRGTHHGAHCCHEFVILGNRCAVGPRTNCRARHAHDQGSVGLGSRRWTDRDPAHLVTGQLDPDGSASAWRIDATVNLRGVLVGPCPRVHETGAGPVRRRWNSDSWWYVVVDRRAASGGDGGGSRCVSGARRLRLRRERPRVGCPCSGRRPSSRASGGHRCGRTATPGVRRGSGRRC